MDERQEEDKPRCSLSAAETTGRCGWLTRRLRPSRRPCAPPDLISLPPSLHQPRIRQGISHLWVFKCRSQQRLWGFPAAFILLDVPRIFQAP